MLGKYNTSTPGGTRNPPSRHSSRFARRKVSGAGSRRCPLEVEGRVVDRLPLLSDVGDAPYIYSASEVEKIVAFATALRSRHQFAVSTLTHWCQSDANVNRELPTYLGIPRSQTARKGLLVPASRTRTPRIGDGTIALHAIGRCAVSASTFARLLQRLLDSPEVERKVTPRTRNKRLAAPHSFFG